MLTSAPSCEIVVAKFHANQLNIKFPTPGDGLDQKTAKSIYNAWIETAMIDNYGAVWILPSRMAEILRTSKGCAKYVIQKMSDNHKKGAAEGTYLRYSEVNKILNNTIMAAGSIKREQYAEYSESIGKSIRDSPTAKHQRATFYESLAGIKKQLKAKRINSLKIFKDELTRQPLLNCSQFSHIRSCAVYPYTSSNVWNGLIVNKNTHKIITDSHVNDEDELRELCRDNKWNIGWYLEFKADLAQTGIAT